MGFTANAKVHITIQPQNYILSETAVVLYSNSKDNTWVRFDDGETIEYPNSWLTLSLEDALSEKQKV